MPETGAAAGGGAEDDDIVEAEAAETGLLAGGADGAGRAAGFGRGAAPFAEMSKYLRIVGVSGAAKLCRSALSLSSPHPRYLSA